MTRAHLLCLSASLILVGCSSTGRRNHNNNNNTGSKDMAGGGGGNCTGSSLELVANKITMPTGASSFTYDFDDNGTAENKFASLLSLIAQTGSGISPQAAADQAVTQDGTLLLLLKVTADDFDASDCASIGVGLADTQPSANLTGSGSFSIDGSLSSMDGTITSGAIATAPTATTTQPGTARLRLPLLDGEPLLEIDLTAVHVVGTLNPTAKKISAGQLHGAVKYSDLKEKILPAMAAFLTQSIQNGNSSIASILDNGCDFGDGVAGDEIIDVCELTEGPLKSSLTPDLDLYSDTSVDANGTISGDFSTYSPSPTTTSSLDNDCLSLGVGFTAVGASF